jgi:hypothetical protein
MKTSWLLGLLISSTLSLTACPGTEQLPPPTAVLGIGIVVSPTQINPKANSTVVLHLNLEHPERAHPTMIVRLIGSSNQIWADPITIDSDSDRAVLELHVGQGFESGISQSLTLQATAEEPNPNTVADQSLPNDGSKIAALFSNATSNTTNANLAAFHAQTGYANFKGSLCQIMASQRRRNLQICLTKPFVAGASYQLVDAKHFGTGGTALITYFEVPALETDLVTNVEANFWDSVNGTLTLTKVSSQLIEFQAEADLVASKDFQKNTATSSFHLQITGHIEDVSNL